MLNLTGLFFLNLLILPTKINELTKSQPIQAKLKKIRQVGLKNPEKNIFAPSVGKKHKKPPLKAVSEESRPQKQQNLSQLKELSLARQKNQGKYQVKKTPNLSVSPKRRQINAQLRNQIYQQKQPYGLIDDVLMKSDFLMKPELPKGIPQDELNSIEKIYFSFQKRMYLQYVNSFISTYNQVIKERPLVKSSLRTSRHNLTARVVFDVEGNIISIKIIKSSPDDDIHELFEQTLRNIIKVPNPPDDFINSENQFVIYYVLNVN